MEFKTKIMKNSALDIDTIQEIATGFGYILGMILHWLYFTLLGSSSKQATLGKYEELKDREIIEDFEKNEKEGKVSFNTIEEIIKK